MVADLVAGFFFSMVGTYAYEVIRKFAKYRARARAYRKEKQEREERERHEKMMELLKKQRGFDSKIRILLKQHAENATEPTTMRRDVERIIKMAGLKYDK